MSGSQNAPLFGISRKNVYLCVVKLSQTSFVIPKLPKAFSEAFFFLCSFFFLLRAN